MIVIVTLTVLLAIAIIKALSYYIGLCAYIRYIYDKGFEKPTDEEIKNIMMWVAKNMFSDVFNRK